MRNPYVQNHFEPIWTCTQNTLAPIPHLHKEIEMIYVKKGSAVAYIDNKSVKITEGDILMVFPNQIHYYLNSDIGEYYVLIFNTDILFGIKDIFYNKLLKNSVINGTRNAEVESLLIKTFNQSGNFSETFIVGYLNQIIALILSKKTLITRTKSNNHTLQNIFEYCANNYTENITLDTVANELHLNKYHISHLVNDQLGMSFSNCINTFRINKSCDLLSETDKKISDISEEVGFGSIRTFNRAFMEIMNLTPLEYRNQTKSVTYTLE